MKYNYFKNCRVVINAGTEVLKIDGKGAPARETPAQEIAGVNIQRTYEDYANNAHTYVRPRFIILKSKS